jgi:hypothetical protein
LPGPKTFGKTITCCNWITAPKPLPPLDGRCGILMCQRVGARVGGRLQRCAAPPRKVQSSEQLARGTEIRSDGAQGLQSSNYCKTFFYAHDFAVPTHIGSLSPSELLNPIAVADSDASGWSGRLHSVNLPCFWLALGYIIPYCCLEYYVSLSPD